MTTVVKQVCNRYGGVLFALKSKGRRSYYTYSNEPAQPIKGKEPEWVTAKQAFEGLLKSGKINFYLLMFTF